MFVRVNKIYCIFVNPFHPLTLTCTAVRNVRGADTLQPCGTRTRSGAGPAVAVAGNSHAVRLRLGLPRDGRKPHCLARIVVESPDGVSRWWLGELGAAATSQGTPATVGGHSDSTVVAGQPVISVTGVTGQPVIARLLVNRATGQPGNRPHFG